MIPAGRRLRMLQVDPNANTPPYDRGLCRALAAAGCRVDLVTSRFLYEALPRPTTFRLDERFFRLATSGAARRLGVDSQPALRRALKAAEYPLDWVLLLGRIAARRPDIVHVQWAVQPTLDLAIWQALRRLGVPLVYTVHNLVPHNARRDDAARYARLYQAADALIVHSERSAASLREEWGVPAERIAVVPHGPLLDTWSPVERAAARRRLGLPADAKLVLFAGLIERYKGLGDLIDAFAILAARQPAAHLVVAGKPNEPFESYRRQIQQHGLTRCSTLDLRFLPESDLAAYLGAADVVVLPYRAVTSSGVLMAARRFRCAVVVTDVGDLSDLIVDGESGLLVPPGDTEGLARAVERLVCDPALAARLGEAGQRIAFGEHGYEEVARRTLAVYRRALGYAS
jgi:glycosyltransferase involved in cell wall biosynthesis